MAGASLQPTNTLAERLLAGDAQALSRALTLVENDHPDAPGLLAEVGASENRPLLIGITGPPGVGKSTLISACVTQLRTDSLRVAVVSIDPSSPLTGGAILGDRLRMSRHVSDPGVFIRSGAARGHLGGLSRNIAAMVRVIAAAGFEVVILETVGTGQSEVEVAGIADACVVMTCPGMGDDIQAMKSGIYDIADVLVVNKADLPDAAGTARSLRGMLKLREVGRQNVPVLEVVAREGTGIAELVQAVAARRSRAE